VFILRKTEYTAGPEKEKSGGVFLRNKTGQRVILIAVISFLVIVLGGTSFAFANPEHTVAAPFKGAAITAMKTSQGAIGLIEDVRAVVAMYERNTISGALQGMRAIEKLSEIPPVIVSTNDMANFPSSEHPLFPDYLDKRYSQFKYTTSSKGIINIDTSGATTDALLKRIRRLLNRLEGRQ